MPMPGRTFNGSEYRYGHNGQEKEDEIAGAGNMMSAEYWMYDSRLLRRWNIDPVVKPWESSYACFNNNPIYYADPRGLDGEGPNGECPGDTKVENGKALTYGRNAIMGKDEWTSLNSADVEVVTYMNSTRSYLTDTSPPIYDDEMTSDLESMTGQVGVTGGLVFAIKEYQLWDNPNKLWSRMYMKTREIDATTGLGASVGYDFGRVDFNKVDAWENPFNRIIEADDPELGFEYGFVRTSYNFGDMKEEKSFTFATVGFGLGIGGFLKGIKEDLDPAMKNIQRHYQQGQ